MKLPLLFRISVQAGLFEKYATQILSERKDTFPCNYENLEARLVKLARDQAKSPAGIMIYGAKKISNFAKR